MRRRSPMNNTPPNPDADRNEMQSRPVRPDRHDLDRLLDGHPVDAGALNGLLAAGRGAGPPAERIGLDNALAHFAERAATRSTSVPSSKRSPLQIAVAKIGSAKMLII